jgi:hypothetical protein
MKDVIAKWEIILHHDRNRDITYSRDVIEEMLTDVKMAVKNCNAPAVSKCEGLQGRELLLAYTQWLSERDNVNTYWLDDSDVDDFLSQQ